MSKLKYNVAIIGATGLIGKKFVQTLENRRFPIGKLRLFASPKNVGKKTLAFGKVLPLESLENNDLKNIDVAFFATEKDVSLKYAPVFEKLGTIVVDNSNAFRQDKDVPLVIPEINPEKIFSSSRKIIANPNCSTIVALTPLKNVYKKYRLKQLIFSTYQSVSGNGRDGIADLLRTRQGFSPSFYPLNISKTILPQIGDIDENGETEEEKKMANETKKIIGADVAVSATCVRVPTENCHGVAVEANFDRPIDLDEIKKEMIFDGVKHSELPNFGEADGNANIFFGRLRKSRVFNNGISFFSVGDNLLKGAALNAVQIAEIIVK